MGSLRTFTPKSLFLWCFPWAVFRSIGGVVIPNELPHRLQQAREELGYSQRKMSEAVGSGARSWQDYESGKSIPGGSVFAALSRLGFNTNWLLTGDGPRLRKDLDPRPLAGPARYGGETFEQRLAYLGSIKERVLAAATDLGVEARHLAGDILTLAAEYDMPLEDIKKLIRLAHRD